MPVDAELVALLRKLFGAPELHRLLQYEPWGADLVQNLAPLEHQPPSQWFHALVLAVHQRGWWAELRALLLRERAVRATETWAVLPDLTLACSTSTPPHAEAIAANQRATVAGDSYLEVGPMVGSVALVYDWTYSLLTPTQRTRWITYANQAVWNVWNYQQAKWGNTTYAWSGWSIDNPSNNYYYSFLKATMLLGLASQGDNSQAQA